MPLNMMCVGGGDAPSCQKGVYSTIYNGIDMGPAFGTELNTLTNDPRSLEFDAFYGLKYFQTKKGVYYYKNPIQWYNDTQNLDPANPNNDTGYSAVYAKYCYDNGSISCHPLSVDGPVINGTVIDQLFPITNWQSIVTKTPKLHIETNPFSPQTWDLIQPGGPTPINIYPSEYKDLDATFASHNNDISLSFVCAPTNTL